MISLIIILLSLVYICCAFPPCSHSRQCDDGDPTTTDICFPRASICLSVSGRETAQISRSFVAPPVTFTSRKTILDKLNKVPLSVLEKLQIIDTGSLLIKEFNPHRFLQLNLYGYDAVSELGELRKNVNSSNQTNAEFHAEMQRVFSRLNDWHTIYIPPPPLQASFAFLGFLIREFYVVGDNSASGGPRRHYVVHDIPEGFRSHFESLNFEEGVEVLKWDGLDIDEAVKKSGEEGVGSNFAAQIAGGVLHLTLRSLYYEKLPLQKNVTVDYRDLSGVEGRITVPWMFMTVPGGTLKQLFGGFSPAVIRSTSDVSTSVMPKIRGLDVDRISDAFKIQGHERVAPGKRMQIPVAKEFESLFAAGIVETRLGPIGHLIIPSFNSTVSDELISELSRVLMLMPKRGLIIDARRNFGGEAQYAKTLSELVSDKEIDQQTQTIRATNLMRDILFSEEYEERAFDTRENVLRMRNGLKTALQAGEHFTGPVSNMYSNAPRVKQVYQGPVISLVDGLTYSGGDVFASLQVDQNMSILVGTSDNVGAGGASAIVYRALVFQAPKVLKPLPEGIDFLTAFQRFYRSGEQQGAMVEHFGIEPQIRYYPTYDDAMSEDSDMFDFLAEKLASMQL